MDRLYILGCGTPFPTADRFGSSYVVRTGDEYLMFDCGPATTWKLAKAGLWPTQIDNLFFTHHHSDHDMDYPCFIETRWDLGVGKVNNLNVYGPTLTELLTTRLIDPEVGAFAHDWKVRTNHPLSYYSYTLRGGVPLPTMGADGSNFRSPPTEMVVASDIGPGKVCEGKDWQVTSAPRRPRATVSRLARLPVGHRRGQHSRDGRHDSLRHRRGAVRGRRRRGLELRGRPVGHRRWGRRRLHVRHRRRGPAGRGRGGQAAGVGAQYADRPAGPDGARRRGRCQVLQWRDSVWR